MLGHSHSLNGTKLWNVLRRAEREPSRETYRRKAGYAPKVMQKAIKQYLNRKENGMSVTDILKVNDIPKASFYVELKKINVEG